MTSSKCTSGAANSDGVGLSVEVSELLAMRLGLKNILLLPRREENPRRGSERDVYWWHIPPGHFGDWCCNRHGTLHGGLCLALFFAFCKAHASLSYGDASKRRGFRYSILREHAQYMRPVFTAAPLAVRTSLGEGGDADTFCATAELYALGQQGRQDSADNADPRELLCRASITARRTTRRHSCL